MDHDGERPEEGTCLEGRYANFLKVGHNAFEFVFDFGQFYARDGRARIHTRVATNPIYAKAMLETLAEAIDHYEQSFGAIRTEHE